NAEGGDQLAGAQSHGQAARRLRSEVRPMSLADGESEDNEDCHGAELCPGGDVREKRAPSQSEDVNASEDCDQDSSDRVRACERHACQRKNHMLLRYEG